MEQANRPAGWEGACGTAGIYGSDLAVNHRVCWQNDDATSSEWVPQAITGVSDAQEDEDWGTSNAEPIAVAYYDAENPGRSNYAKDRDNCVQDSASDACNEKGIRVSFFNQATQMYRHVLLVWPYMNSKDHISFDALHASEGKCTTEVTSSCAAQNGIHAGGMVWYGNYLYVADTANGMRVFDLRKIMDLNPDNKADVDDPTPDGLVSNVTDKKRIGSTEQRLVRLRLPLCHAAGRHAEVHHGEERRDHQRQPVLRHRPPEGLVHLAGPHRHRPHGPR